MNISLMNSNIPLSQAASNMLDLHCPGLNPDLGHIKREHETLIMFQLSRPIIKQIKSGAFANPMIKPSKISGFPETKEQGRCKDMSQSSPSTRASSQISDCDASNHRE